MTRRMALALAVALTTVVAFGLVAMGRESGLFGGAGAGDDTLASAQQPPASATPDVQPDVTTEYIYLDESPAPQAPDSSDASAQSGVSSENSSHDDDDDAWEDDEREDEEDEDEHHEDEHEDEHEHESEWDD